MTYMKENNIKYEQASGVNMNNNALAISEHINYDVNFCENNNTCTSRKLANLNTTIVEPVASFKYISSSKKIELRGNGGNTYLAIQFVEVGKTPSDWKIFGGYLMCLSENTEVYVYDEKKKKYRKKKIGDLTYDDEVLCWNFDKGEFTKAKPIWLMKKMKTTKYNLLKFSDGSALETIDQHRIFNVEKGMFTYPMTDDTPIGTTTFNSKGEYVSKRMSSNYGLFRISLDSFWKTLAGVCAIALGTVGVLLKWAKPVIKDWEWVKEDVLDTLPIILIMIALAILVCVVLFSEMVFSAKESEKRERLIDENELIQFHLVLMLIQ